MKRLSVFVSLCLVFMLAWALGAGVQSQGRQSGVIIRSIPSFSVDKDAKDSQIVRGRQYVSIGIAAAHISYRSGFLKNVKQIVVSSNVSLDIENQNAHALKINKTWKRSSNKAEEHIPVNDLLVVMSPATTTNITIKVEFSGIGQDRFKGIFDILSGQDATTLLNFTPTAISQIGKVSSIIQKFLQTPYTDKNPLNILTMSHGLVIYPDRNVLRPDSLRQGYLVYLSAIEKKNTDLSSIASLSEDAIQFDEVNGMLKLRQPDQTWHPFTGNSYIVLRITTSSVRGEDQNAQWSRKFAEAVRLTEELRFGAKLEKIKQDAHKTWEEGVVLLAADPNYIESERVSLRIKAANEIYESIKSCGVDASVANLADTFKGLPENLSEVVAAYNRVLSEFQSREFQYHKFEEKPLLADAASLTVQVTDQDGSTLPGVSIAVTSPFTQPMELATDQSGNVQIWSLRPGEYNITASLQGFKQVNTHIKLSPGQRGKVTIKIELAPKNRTGR